MSDDTLDEVFTLLHAEMHAWAQVYRGGPWHAVRRPWWEDPEEQVWVLACNDHAVYSDLRLYAVDVAPAQNAHGHTVVCSAGRHGGGCSKAYRSHLRALEIAAREAS